MDPIFSYTLAISRGYEKNTQEKCPYSCRCREYDEHYWSHVYEGISWCGYESDGDTPPKAEEGMLKTVARAAYLVAANVV